MSLPSEPAQVAPGSRRLRQQLPRLVEQMRILTWFQFHLTLVTLLVAIVIAATLSSRRLANFGVGGDPIEQQLERVEVLCLALTGTAILLAVTAALVRRGFAVAFPLVLLAEVAVLVDVALAAGAGIVLRVVVVLLVILGVWILVDLFRREVWTFLLRSSHR
jgi:hypothetical protein